MIYYFHIISNAANAIKRIQNAALFFFFVFFLLAATPNAKAQTQTAVQKYGAIHVNGTKIVDKNGSPVTLRGMSLYWSQWEPRYYNYNTIKWLRDDWKVTIVRAAMAVDYGGYATNPTTEQNKIYTVIDACISLGIYVIVDFHMDVNNFTSNAKTFFNDVSKKYGNTPNIIYEPWNEPINDSWANVIKPYHESIIDIIRKNASNALVICGTSFYSQNVDEASYNPVNRSNVAYTLHFYANTHKQSLRDKAQVAINNGKAIFVTEYGTTDASGDGYVNQAETNTWWSFLDANGIGYCNWSVADVPESAAALVNSSVGVDNWSTSQLKESGNFVRNMLRAKAPDLSTTTSGAVSDGTYKLTFRHSGLSMNVEGASTADGGNVIQWGYNNGRNEQWFVKNLGNGQYSIINANSGRGLDVTNASTADGADINQWYYSGNNNQKWLIQSVGSGYYKIVNVNSNKCIDMYNNSTAAGTSIDQWTCNGGNNQSFTFTKLSTATSRTTASVNNSATAQTATASVYPNPSSGAFTVQAAGSYRYTISNATGAAVEKGSAQGKASVGKSLRAGVYIISISSADGNQKIKLVKN